jgi:hypothetical protein
LWILVSIPNVLTGNPPYSVVFITTAAIIGQIGGGAAAIAGAAAGIAMMRSGGRRVLIHLMKTAGLHMDNKGLSIDCPTLM